MHLCKYIFRSIQGVFRKELIHQYQHVSRFSFLARFNLLPEHILRVGNIMWFE